MILCCGEALIDMLPRHGAGGELLFAPHCGGAVYNTAIALGRLGAPAGFLSGISTDFFGDMLLDGLAAAQVDHARVIRSDRPTTLAFVRLVDGQATYAFNDENTAGRMLAAADMPETGPDVQAMFFGGISLAVEPCGGAYEALMLREASRRPVMLDPNIRPGFIRDEAAYRTRIVRMIAAATVVKLSDEDLHWLQGPGDEGDLARALLQRGPSIVLVTSGGQGAAAYVPGGEIRRPARKVKVVDTVGAGDTFNAGFLASLHADGALSLEALRAPAPGMIARALELGMAAAAVTVSRAGANPPWRSELA
ncbi:carbohydrate kinase family protein [Zhengella sp. ZM62]|uniref:carbohydrate kinase family protein n=1 Tax=Zhengella sedimenti TaxID=3390035 RepID=UPI0039760D1F